MDSSVGPVIVTNYDESHSHGISVYGAEFDLCELLQTLTLSKGKTKKGSRKRSNSPCCPLCLAKGKRGRCKHRGSSVPLRRGIIKFKVQLLRSSHHNHNHNLQPHQPPAQLMYPSPALSASRMPLPPIHPRFTRPRIPRALSVPLPLPRVITLPDDGRRIPGHDSHSSRPAQCISTCTQRLCDCPAGNSKSSRSEGVAGRS